MSFGNTGEGFIAGLQVVENIIHGKQRDFHSWKSEGIVFVEGFFTSDT